MLALYYCRVIEGSVCKGGLDEHVGRPGTPGPGLKPPVYINSNNHRRVMYIEVQFHRLMSNLRQDIKVSGKQATRERAYLVRMCVIRIHNTEYNTSRGRSQGGNTAQ